jgi:hypothetical protein
LVVIVWNMVSWIQVPLPLLPSSWKLNWPETKQGTGARLLSSCDKSSSGAENSLSKALPCWLQILLSFPRGFPGGVHHAYSLVSQKDHHYQFHQPPEL